MRHARLFAALIEIIIAGAAVDLAAGGQAMRESAPSAVHMEPMQLLSAVFSRPLELDVPHALRDNRGTTNNAETHQILLFRLFICVNRR